MKKQLLAIFLAIVMLLCACGAQQPPAEETVPTGTEPAQTEPSQAEPDVSNIDELQPNAEGIYQIYSVKGLQNMENVPDGNFELMQDIDLGGASWTAIGTQELRYFYPIQSLFLSDW